MAAIDLATLDRWRTLQIVDRDGGTVGSISEFYLDRETRHPTWALVNVGLFGARQVFVPLLEATEISDGLQVPYEKGHIKDAPRFDLHGELTPQEEAALATHYGIEYEPVTGEGAAAEAAAGEAGAGAIGAVGGAGAADAAAAQEAAASARGAEGTGAVEAEATEGTGATAVGAAEAAGPGAATGPGPAEDGPRADEQASAAQDERAAEWEQAENGDPAQARATDDLAWPASPPPPGPITEPPGEPPEVTRADRDR